MIEGDAQAAFISFSLYLFYLSVFLSQKEAEEKDRFTLGSTPVSLILLVLSLSWIYADFVLLFYYILSLLSFLFPSSLFFFLADFTLVRPEHLPPLDLNPIYFYC